MMRAQRTRTGNDRDERAVSEAISYVLVFALITVGGILVAVQGLPAINNAQDEQVAGNSERVVELMQDRVDEMVRQGAPRREVPVNLQDMRVGIGDMEPSRINVTVTPTDNSIGNSVTLADVETDPVYIKTTAGNLEQTSAYVNGAVLVGRRGVNESWTMPERPSWGITTNSSTQKVENIFLRTVSTTGSGGVGGGQTARVLFETASREDETLRIDKINISVESPRNCVEPPRKSVWDRYFDRIQNGVQGGDVSNPSTPPSCDRVKEHKTVTLTIDEFHDGSGTVIHKKRLIRTEVKAR
jgi:hypothetical protein